MARLGSHNAWVSENGIYVGVGGEPQRSAYISHATGRMAHSPISWVFTNHHLSCCSLTATNRHSTDTTGSWTAAEPECATSSISTPVVPPLAPFRAQTINKVPHSLSLSTSDLRPIVSKAYG